MSKYEQLIEYIINENEDKARELFHQIVVEKSREIYESLIDEQDLEEVGGNEVESMVDEITGDEEGLDEGDDEFGGDEGDDMGGDDLGGDDLDGDDFGGDEMGGDEFGGEEAGLEDRVMDLEDALDELKAEFDSLMGQEAGEPEHMGGDDMGGLDHGMGGEEDMAEMGMMEGEEEDDDEEEEEDLEESRKPARKMTEAEWLREYVDQIGDAYPGNQANPSGQMVGTGAKSEKQGEKNTKSPVGPGVNMGGNVIKAKGGEQNPDGKQIAQPSNEYSKNKGDLPGAGKFKNVPGGDAGKSSFKTKEGSYESGGDGQGNPTGKMVGTGKNSEKQGEKNVKPLLKKIGK